MTYRERKEAKAAKRRDWAEGRREKATGELQQVEQMSQQIPLGQPILVGHHSERAHRNLLTNMDRKMGKGIEHSNMATHHDSVATNIEHQLDTSIYSDDTDAISQLKARIAEREAERTRIKVINSHAKKTGTLHGIDLTKAELKDIEMAALGGHDPRKGYPSYALTNLSANIRRDQQRLEKLQEERHD